MAKTFFNKFFDNKYNNEYDINNFLLKIDTLFRNVT